MTSLILLKCIVSGVCDDVNVQKFVMYLSAALHVFQGVKVWCMDLHYVLILYFIFEMILVNFVYLGAWGSPQLPPTSSLLTFRSSIWRLRSHSYVQCRSLLTQLWYTYNLEGDGPMFGKHPRTKIGRQGNKRLYKTHLNLALFLSKAIVCLQLFKLSHVTSLLGFVVSVPLIIICVCAGIIVRISPISLQRFVLLKSVICSMACEQKGDSSLFGLVPCVALVWTLVCAGIFVLVSPLTFCRFCAFGFYHMSTLIWTLERYFFFFCSSA